MYSFHIVLSKHEGALQIKQTCLLLAITSKQSTLIYPRTQKTRTSKTNQGEIASPECNSIKFFFPMEIYIRIGVVSNYWIGELPQRRRIRGEIFCFSIM
jgi:hypothetical protein